MSVSISVNPRWKSANYEMVVEMPTGVPIPDPYPLRFETPDIDLSDLSKVCEKAVPWFLVTEEDGSTRESF